MSTVQSLRKNIFQTVRKIKDEDELKQLLNHLDNLPIIVEIKKKSSKPKRARSAYILFCNAKRDKAKTEDPTISPQELTKKLANMWKNTSAEERQLFNTQSIKDKDRCHIEMKAWQDSMDTKIVETIVETPPLTIQEKLNEKIKELVLWYENQITMDAKQKKANMVEMSERLLKQMVIG